MIERLGAGITRLVEKRPGLVLGVGLLLLGASIALTLGLPIDQEFRRLLPPDAEEVTRLAELDRRLGNQSDLVVAIESPSREANLKFGEELAKRMRARGDLRWVDFRRDPEFFEDRSLLFMELPELLELHDDVLAKITESVADALIEDVEGAGEETREAGETDEDDPLSEDRIKEKYNEEERFQEYMETDEGRLIVIKARPRTSNSDLAYAQQLSEEIAALATAIGTAGYHPDLTVSVEGSYGEQTKRAKTMRNAVLSGTLACLFILLLSIGLYFRSARAVGWILVPLLVSVFCALGFARLAYGHLNLVTAFIFAVLLGLGIDFGVHVLSRYRDERGRGQTRSDAIRTAITTTGVSTAAGAFSTAGCFFVLGISRFQGFAQFGVVAAVGVLLALAAALLLLPALVVLTGGKGDHTFGFRGRPAGEHRVSPQFPKGAALILLFTLSVALYGGLRGGDVEFEYDLSKLGPKRDKPKPTKVEEAQADATQPGGARQDAPKKADAKKAEPQTNDEEKWRDAAGRGTDTAPSLVLTENLEQAEQVHRQLAVLIAERKKREAAEEARNNPPPPESAKEDDEDEDEDDEDDDDDDEFNVEDDAIVQVRKLAAQADVTEPRIAKLLQSYNPERREAMTHRLLKIFSIYDFVPDNQQAKLVLIQNMKRKIDQKRERLAKKDRENVDEWYHTLEVTEAFGVDDLPPWLKDQMTDADGRLGSFVMFWAYGPKADYNNAKLIRDGFFDIALEEGTAPSAANYYVLPGIIEAIRDDAPKVIFGALLVMFLASWLLMGGIEGPLVVFLTVGTAVLWLGALMVTLGWKADLFNIIALPLLVGIGQDDALHLYHRYREEGPGSLRTAVRETGAAIFLTTLTTSIGFAGIFFANHRGLHSLARVAVSGVVLCWLSSVVVLPAAIRCVEWWRARSVAPAR